MTFSGKVSDSILMVIRDLAEEYRPANNTAWLSDHPSFAFLVCIAQGPWQEKRRSEVATKAVDWLIKQNTLDIGGAFWDTKSQVYPLEWQNNHLRSMMDALKERNVTFYDAYFDWIDSILKGGPDAWVYVLQELFSMCGVPESGTKVLWLFARDSLQIPAFPIDRRVKRVLAEYGLPADPWFMTHACQQAGVNTNELARAFFARAE